VAKIYFPNISFHHKIPPGGRKSKATIQCILGLGERTKVLCWCLDGKVGFILKAASRYFIFQQIYTFLVRLYFFNGIKFQYYK
jgi:hypothetical protein